MIIDALTALPSTPTTGDELPIERGTTTYKIDYDALATAIINKLGTVLKPSDVVDSLTSMATDKPGSANMLKTLNDMIAFEATTISNTNLELSIARFGRVVTIFFSAIKNLETGNNTDVATLPAGFRPWRNVQQDMRAPSTGYDCRVTIASNGNISIYNYSSNTGSMNMEAMITFIAGT